MNKKVKAALASYGRALLACAVTAFVASGVSLTDLTKADALKIANAIWVAFVPVLIRALNPNDSAYGLTNGNQH